MTTETQTHARFYRVRRKKSTRGSFFQRLSVVFAQGWTKSKPPLGSRCSFVRDLQWKPYFADFETQPRTQPPSEASHSIQKGLGGLQRSDFFFHVFFDLQGSKPPPFSHCGIGVPQKVNRTAQKVNQTKKLSERCENTYI